MTNTAIKEGFEKLKDGKEYDNLYYSAVCRSHADWLVGINASRCYSVKYNSNLSIGRVQTPTLALIVDRQKEIDSFVPEKYFEIKAFYDGFDGKYVDKKLNTKIEDEERAKTILAEVKGRNAIVKSLNTEDKSVAQPLLFDLTELQRVCNRKFGYSAQQTLDIVQDLYEKRKYITYPRTDSRYLSKDMIPQLKGIVSKLSETEYKQYTDYVLSLDKLPISNRIVDDSKVTDHHAIIPTFHNFNTSTLNKNEYNVFDLIARRFLAVFYPKYEYQSTTLITTINTHDFLSRGTTVIKLGFREVNNDDVKKKDDTQILPNVDIGTEINVLEVKKENQKTKPKKYFTEATLLTEMENAGNNVEDEELRETLKESGIGTPATRASIIERLIQVGYIKREKKNLLATQKGITLVEILPKQLISAETTGRWEKGLSKISKGEMEKDKFMESINKFVRFLVNDAKVQKKDVFFEPKNKFKPSKDHKTFGACPKCGSGYIMENTKSYYCTNWRSGCKFSIWKDAFTRKNIEIELNEEIISAILKDKKIELPLNDSSKICVVTLKDNFTLDVVIN